MNRTVMAAFLLGICCLAEAQTPRVQQVLQAASRKAPCDACSLTSGSMAIVVGEGLAAGAEASSSTPLPTTLAGTSVMMGDQAVPLFSVSPTEILLQLPNHSSLPAAVLGLVVRSTTGTSDPFPVRVSPWGTFAVFTRDGTECGPPLVFNLERSESGVRYVENSPLASAKSGQVITLFGTGLPYVDFFSSRWPSLGVPTPDGLSSPFAGMLALVGDRAFRLGETLFAGRVPGLIGVDQLNIEIRGSATEGCNLPVRLAAPDILAPASADFPVSIGSSGQCTTPPPRGKILWKKAVIPYDASATVVETLEVAIAESPFPPDIIAWPEYGPGPTPTTEGFRILNVPEAGPRCTEDEFTHHLPIERIAFQPAGQAEKSQRLEESRNGSGYRQIDLPAGSIRPGRFTVSIEDSRLGGAQSPLQIPEPIGITTELPPGRTFIYRPPGYILSIPLRWEGGDPNSWVMGIVRRPGWIFATRVPASKGSLDLGLNVPPGVPFEVEVWNYREGPEAEHVAMPGLDGGLEHGWRYVFRYLGLRTSVSTTP